MLHTTILHITIRRLHNSFETFAICYEASRDYLTQQATGPILYVTKDTMYTSIFQDGVVQ